jgi:hypothetical protein
MEVVFPGVLCKRHRPFVNQEKRRPTDDEPRPFILQVGTLFPTKTNSALVMPSSPFYIQPVPTEISHKDYSVGLTFNTPSESYTHRLISLSGAQTPSSAAPSPRRTCHALAWSV